MTDFVFPTSFPTKEQEARAELYPFYSVALEPITKETQRGFAGIPT